jgi:heme-degrading monooxygenase HmoA
MIVRTWRGYAEASRRHAYPEHFRANVRPGLEAVAGFLGASLLARDLGEEVEFLVVTRWRAMEAVRSFAGEEAERAVVEPEAVAALVRFDSCVQHYEVLEEVAPGRT